MQLDMLGLKHRHHPELDSDQQSSVPQQLKSMAARCLGCEALRREARDLRQASSNQLRPVSQCCLLRTVPVWYHSSLLHSSKGSQTHNGHISSVPRSLSQQWTCKPRPCLLSCTFWD